ncbi:MAG: hypothetical protein SFW67_07170 [Myxococcaceae bacterium]|nr:hypothetical protein [Myxococcaceae bacterium]
MRLVLVAGLAVSVLCGCPKRKEPERGLELVFTKKGDVRLSVERRLARLDVRARLFEDGDTLSVRLPDTGTPVDVSAVKALLLVPAKLEFCAEARLEAGANCAPWTLEDGGMVGANVERIPDDGDRDTCMVVGPSAEPLRQTIDAGPSRRVLVGPHQGRLRTYVAESSCLSPRVLKAEAAMEHGPMVSITFDGPTASKFSELTAATVKRRLFIVLDDVVTSAPVVMEPITGGRAMVTLGQGTGAAKAKQLAAALEGGPIEGGLTLVREGAYGPPRLLP